MRNPDSVGDAVITTDTEGLVTSLNPVAESMTGWIQTEAVGVSLKNVFKIVNAVTRTTIESPTIRALRDGVNVGLANLRCSSPRMVKNTQLALLTTVRLRFGMIWAN